MWKEFVKSTWRTVHVLLLLWGICSAGITMYLAGKLSVNVDVLSASVNYADEASFRAKGLNR